MSSRFSSWARRRPLPAFYLLAFSITWSAWGAQAAHSHDLFPFDSPLLYLLGGAGPLLAALAVQQALRGKGAHRELFEPLGRWRVAWWWYAVALALSPLIWLVSREIGDGTSELEHEAAPALLLAFAVAFVAAIPEEVAWRGFALPRLQARHSALLASLVVGALWALWHLPLLLVADDVMSTYPVIPYFLAVTASSVIYTWVFNSTLGSVLLVTLLHASSNAWAGPFVGTAETAVTVLLAAALVLAFGARDLSRRGRVAAVR